MREISVRCGTAGDQAKIHKSPTKCSRVGIFVNVNVTYNTNVLVANLKGFTKNYNEH